MEIVIKCDNKINPAAADRDDVWFSAEVSGGIADGFVFSISKAGRVIYKKEIKSGFFPVLRPDIAFSENTRYHYEAIAYLGKNEVASSSRRLRPERRSGLRQKPTTTSRLFFPKLSR